MSPAVGRPGEGFQLWEAASMWARKRIDISWTDLAFGAARCFVPARRRGPAPRIETLWSAAGDTLAALSVRTAFDLLLTALDLPRGGEVLVSAVTIRDMTRIIEEHGLLPVAIDLDPATMAPDLERLHQAVTPATRAILVAHLFGGRIDLGPIARFAAEHGLALIEDCAQAYAGSEFTGHPAALASMFSFGPIKTATALGGALVRVRDPAVWARMRRLQAEYPRQGRWAFLRRLCKYAALKAMSTRPVYGALLRLCRALGVDHDRLVNGAVRGFAGEGFFARIRRQPSAALLALMERRVPRFDRRRLVARAAAGEALLERLGDVEACPGAANTPHSHWVFPFWVDDPPGAIAALARAGFDATQG
ncbi:MAG TPA: DegT/DnrJ/EryC1/StrS family aminotransferase, partial [Pirellulales bacterium]|nr:DegT/DnrJ/EryC1/StrS family aminotransferase [Pirellulales bacterium]